MNKKILYQSLFTAVMGSVLMASSPLLAQENRGEGSTQSDVIDLADPRIVTLLVTGSGPNPTIARNNALMLLRGRCIQLNGVLLGFPNVSIFGSGFAYSALASQPCATSS